MPPIDRIAQMVRLRRFAAAALTSLLIACLAWVIHYLGLMDANFLVAIVVGILASICVFYLLIHSGWNESLRDPSLTIPMIMASSTVNTIILFAVDKGRGAFLLVYLMSLLFGVFRLSTRQLLGMASFILASYAVVIWRLRMDRPDVFDPMAEYVQWIVLAVVLLWFSVMGGYISTLITRLSQSEIDELTGAYSRRRIIDILRHEGLRADRSAGPLSICLLDIDKLKTVNDHFGHQGGDEILKRVVQAVQQELRGIDYVGRYGGDEFLVIMTETPLRGALECAERIRRTLEAMWSAGEGSALSTTVSMGLAEYAPGESLTQTVGRADAALYAAKSAGRDRIECAVAPAELSVTG